MRLKIGILIHLAACLWPAKVSSYTVGPSVCSFWSFIHSTLKLMIYVGFLQHALLTPTARRRYRATPTAIKSRRLARKATAPANLATSSTLTSANRVRSRKIESSTSNINFFLHLKPSAWRWDLPAQTQSLKSTRTAPRASRQSSHVRRPSRRRAPHVR